MIYIVGYHCRGKFSPVQEQCDRDVECGLDRDHKHDNVHDEHLAISVEAKLHRDRSNCIEVFQHEFPHQRPC